MNYLLSQSYSVKVYRTNALRAVNQNSGGGSFTVGELAQNVGITLGSLESFMQLSFVLNLRQQLINAGWNNPENISAKFDDWTEIVNKVTSINEVYRKTTSGGYKLEFKLDNTIRGTGEAAFNVIKVNMLKNKNLLEYAFTIGHEMTHSFTDLHFRSRFFELYTERNGQTMRDHTYTFFKEVVGVGWEINHGATRYGGLNDVKGARKYYKHIMTSAMDQIEPYLNILKKEWQKVYNSK